MFENILFPIDPSRAAMDTARKAVELARSNSSRLILLSVTESESGETTVPESVQSFLSQVRQEFEQVGIKCDVLERFGKPAFVICDVADELDVDLIVMGTRGVNLEGDAESTAVRVIQLAPCPVLVVP